MPRSAEKIRRALLLAVLLQLLCLLGGGWQLWHAHPDRVSLLLGWMALQAGLALHQENE